MAKSKHLSNQVFWYSTANYLGFFLGFIASVFLYPNNLTFLGEIRYIETIGQFLFPILLFGLPQSLIKFSPFMKDYHIPRYCGNAILIVGFLSLLTFFLLKTIDFINPLHNFNFIIYGFVLAVCFAFIDLVKSRAITLDKVNTPIFIEKVLPKIALPIFFILLYKNYISEIETVNYYLISYIVIVIGLFLYIYQFSKPVFSSKYYFLFENFSVKEFVNYSFYSFLGSFASLIAFRIDNFMIPQFLTMEDNGAYNIALTVSGLIGVPSAGVFALNAPIISRLIEKNKLKKLGKRYLETSKLLFWIGALFFSLMLISLQFIPQIFNNYIHTNQMTLIIVLLGSSVLINMGSGFNTEIILYSNHFKFNLIAVFVLAISNIGLNYYFLTETNLGLLGVAIASLSSIILYNTIKLLFIYKKFNITPFDKNYFWLIVISVTICFITYFIPDFEGFLLNFLIKSFLILSLNLYFVYKFNLIESVSNLIIKTLRLK